MPQRDGSARLGVAFQPVQNQRLQHQLGIGQVPGAILLKRFKEFRIEPIRSLNGQRFADTLGDLYWFVSLDHNEQSLHGLRSLGKLCIRPCASGRIAAQRQLNLIMTLTFIMTIPYCVRMMLGLSRRACVFPGGHLIRVGLRAGFTRCNRRMFVPPGGGMIMQHINGFSKDRVVNPPADRRVDPDAATARGVPGGLPAWITVDLIAETLHVWQPYYAQPLTPEDAIGILLNVGGLFTALSGGDHPACRHPGMPQLSRRAQKRNGPSAGLAKRGGPSG